MIHVMQVVQHTISVRLFLTLFNCKTLKLESRVWLIIRHPIWNFVHLGNMVFDILTHKILIHIIYQIFFEIVCLLSVLYFDELPIVFELFLFILVYFVFTLLSRILFIILTSIVKPIKYELKPISIKKIFWDKVCQISWIHFWGRLKDRINCYPEEIFNHPWD